MKGRSPSHFLAGTPGAKDSGPEAARVWGLAHILALGSRKRVVGPYPGRLALVERRGVSLAAPDVPLTLFYLSLSGDLDSEPGTAAALRADRSIFQGRGGALASPPLSLPFMSSEIHRPHPLPPPQAGFSSAALS